MNHLKYIFFDLDGTLVDSSKGIQESLNTALNNLEKSVLKKVL